MPEPLPNGHALSPLFQQVGRTRMTQAVAAGREARGFRIPLDLLWDGFDRQRTAGPLLISEDHVTRHITGTVLQTRVHARHGIRCERHPAILAAFPVFDQQGVLRPVEITHLELRHFGYSPATPEPHEKPGPVHRMVALGKQRF
jgi:hypothetical protein